MDTLRGSWDFGDDNSAHEDEFAEDHSEREAPPAAIGQDERRMQVRAYNHWASELEDRNFPPVSGLRPADLPDFGPYGVLLDFAHGIENPKIAFIGQELAKECGADTDITQLSDVPSRSLLSRITDHYLQILANQAPIGFEAEFVNQRGQAILYRGILLPYSSDDQTIDFVFGVINWKELADAQATEELLLEIDQVLSEDEALPRRRSDEPLEDWADAPLCDGEDDVLELGEADGTAMLSDDFDDSDDDEEVEGPGFGSLTGGGFTKGTTPTKATVELPQEPEDIDDFRSTDDPGAAELPTAKPHFGSLLHDDPDAPEGTVEFGEADDAAKLSAEPAHKSADDVVPASLADWLAGARDYAREASAAEDRSRRTLYAAISRAYDFALAAQNAPDEYAEILEDTGIQAQDRAPMTPVAKLVFGIDYDKTRLTEYAAALSYAQRKKLGVGELAAFIEDFDGGLKGIVQDERRLRREESGRPAKDAESPLKRLAKRLRAMVPLKLTDIEPDGEEFALIVVRRSGDGTIDVLGEVPNDSKLVAKAARKLIG